MKQLNVLIFYLLSALGLLVVRPGYAQDAVQSRIHIHLPSIQAVR